MTKTHVARQKRHLAAARKRVAAFRAKNPLAKLKNGYSPVSRFLPRVHRHTCVVKKCSKKYSCSSACDPVGEGLENSICNDCLLEAQTQ